MTPRATKHQRRHGNRNPAPIAPFAPGYGIVGANEGKGLLSWTWVARKLNTCRTFWLSSINAANGRPHVMPLWGVWLDDAFCFLHRTKIPQRPKPSRQFRLHNYQRRRSRGRNHRRTSHEVEDAAELDRIAAAYKKKYKMDPRSMKEPIYSVRPTKVFGFIEKTFPKSATMAAIKFAIG